MSSEDTQETKQAEEKNNELQNIRHALDTLNQHRFVKLYNSTFKMLWFQFLKGMMFGLGSVAGATIIVSIVISFLGQIEFIPIIGEWAKAIMVEIQQAKP